MKKYRSKKAGKNIVKTYDTLLQQWQVETEEINIPSRYGTTHIIIAGNQDASPLILFHGVGDDSALMWIYNAKELAQHYRLYAVDTIGGPGKSEMNDCYNNTIDDVLWIDETLDRLGLGQVNMAGVSHGAYLVQLYTLKRPERVLRSICISSSVSSGQNGTPLKTMMKIFMPEALFPTKKNTVRLLKKLSGSHPEVFTENADIMAHYQWLLKGFNNMAMGYHRINHFTSEEIDKIREHVIFLVGNEDPFQMLGGKDELLKYRMNVVFYPRAGHGLNHELANEINHKMISILDGVII